ncbi:lipid droplet-associated protein [Sciscionella sediminilitoris]|uniref:lipid droplet-associated protein n=1 Tax=Sciscionella sediminilitoris TaxID=1445613 RepID=UPI0004DF570A|nr:lipid droplet-associated protein [Sciscionella sp. SE31]
MKRLPFGVRLAAGITATMVENARTLPTKLLGLPVTVVSEALQYTMRLQQGLTELAIKGDTALAGLRPVEKAPAWATFDEDLLDDEGSGDSYGSAPIETAGIEEREIAKLRADLTRYDERDPSALSAWDAVARQLATQTEERPEPAEPEPPHAFPNYPELSLAQLRARLRRFSVEDLGELLEYELATHDRADYVRMLRNRIETVRQDSAENPGDSAT